MKILIVDDEAQIRKLVQVGLHGYGYDVLIAENGAEALFAVAQHRPDLVILDISLGSEPNGIEVCRQMREWSQVPIMMLSVRSEEITKVQALDAGADDYLTKPFGIEELRARIQAILRRQGSERTSPTQIRSKDLLVDLVNRRVFVEGDEIHLTPKEYDLLRLLATHPGKVITHHTILTEVWGEDAGTASYVRVFINNIRKKLRENPGRDVRYILTESGIGYRFIDAN